MRPLPSRLSQLAAAVSAFRPGTSVPAATAPFSGGPVAAPMRRSLDRRLRRSLAASTAEGMAAEVVAACAGGAVLTGWALHLALPPVLVALLAGLPFASQLLHLPAAWLTSLLGRRRVAIVAVTLSRQVYLPLVLAPLLPLPLAARQGLLIAVAAVAAVLGVVGNNAWVSWMGELVPVPLRGRYFGRRTALCTLAGGAGTLGAGLLLDRLLDAGHEELGLSMLAAFACLAGLASSLLMRLQHDPCADGGREPVDVRVAAQPFTDLAARPLLGYQVAWNGAIGVSAAFFAVYQLRELRMGFALVAAYGTLVAAVRVAAAPLWGRFIDRAGAHRALVTCSFAIPAIPVVWLFVRPDTLWLLVPEAVLSGALWSGHALASFQLPLELAPRRGRPFYLAAFASAGGLAFALAAIAGGAAAGALPAHVRVLGEPFAGLQVLFGASAVLRLVAATLSPAVMGRGAGAPAAIPAPALAARPGLRG